MTSYLSIDLDYFAMEGTEDYKSADKFLKKVLNLKLPIFVCKYHDEILEDLNDIKVDNIYQIDYHSDITIEPVVAADFNEGTWANFYQYKKQCTYEWRYPDVELCFRQGKGRCDWHTFDKENDTPVEKWSPKDMGYKKVVRLQGLNGLDWSSIISVGISLSPNWCMPEIDVIYDKYSFKDYL